MLIISVAFFILGIFAFMDTVFYNGGIFQWFTSVILISMSLWLYVRVRNYKNLKKIEIFEAQKFEPEKQTAQTNQQSVSSKKEPEKIHS